MGQDDPSHATSVTKQTPSLCPVFSRIRTEELVLTQYFFFQQQLVLPHPRLPLPVVGEGPRDPPRPGGDQHDATRLDGVLARRMFLVLLYTNCFCFFVLRMSGCFPWTFTFHVVLSSPAGLVTADARRSIRRGLVPRCDAMRCAAATLWMRCFWESGKGSGANASDIPCNFTNKKRDGLAISPMRWIAGWKPGVLDRVPWWCSPAVVHSCPQSPPHVSTREQRSPPVSADPEQLGLSRHNCRSLDPRGIRRL